MSEKKKKALKIGIDARFYGPANKGLGRYAQEIVDRIVKIDTENEYVIFLYQDNYDLFQTSDSRIKKVKLNIRWYTLKEQLLFPWYIWREKVDLVHFLHFNVPVFTPSKFIVTVHDLILTKFPTVRASTLSPFLYKIKNFCYQIVIWAVIKRARLIIAVSEFTKKDLVDKYKIKPEKMIVTYEGVSGSLEKRANFNPEKNDDKKTLLSYNIKKPYVLYVGNAYPHKNLEGLLDIWPAIKKEREDLQLVFVGKMDYFYKRIEEYSKKLYKTGNSDSGIVFTGFVKDEDLSILYKNASIYVFPSKYEGFGLPPLEAMVNGCPVASSSSSCLPEILGEAALYFDPDNSGDMKNKIIQLVNDGRLRQKLIKKGFEQVKKYSWRSCAELSFRAYQKILNK